MSRLTSIRNKLTQKVFNGSVGTDVDVIPVTKGSSSDGGFTPGADSDAATVTVKGVPYSNSTSQWFKGMFGESDLAESSVLVPYDTSVSAGDKVSWLSQTYYVEEVEDFTLGGGVVAKQLLVNERIST